MTIRRAAPLLLLLAAGGVVAAVTLEGGDPAGPARGGAAPRAAVRDPSDDLDEVLAALGGNRYRAALAGVLDLLRRGGSRLLPEARQETFAEVRVDVATWAYGEAEILAAGGDAAAATGLMEKADRVAGSLPPSETLAGARARTQRVLDDLAAAAEAAARAAAAEPTAVDLALRNAAGSKASADPAAVLKALEALLADTTDPVDRGRLEEAAGELRSTLVARQRRAKVRSQVDAAVRKGDYARARKLADGLVAGAAGDPTVSDEEAQRDRERREGLAELEENAEPAALAAVREGLRWMVRQRLPDGSFGWTAAEAKEKGLAEAAREKHPHRQGLTALATLALVGHARYDYTDEFTPVVDELLAWLLATQGKNGAFPGDLYAHSLGTIVLVDAERLLHRSHLRPAAARALVHLQDSVNSDGGWRYRPRTPPSDVSVTGWALQAILHARYAHYEEVRPEILDGAFSYIDRMTDPTGRVGYMNPGSGSNAMTAAALFCRLRLGQGTDDSRVTDAAERILQSPPKAGWKETSYTLFYASDAMSRLGGTYWSRWSPGLKKLLLETQVKKGDGKGGWPVKGDRWAEREGTVYLAAMHCLALENYFEHR